MNSEDLVQILGVRVSNLSRDAAIAYLRSLLDQDADSAHSISIVNAHTLNLAATDPNYRSVLNASDLVLGDGTGVRWAARQRGVEMKANLVGTDLVPDVLDETADLGYRMFVLGTTEESIKLAAEYCRKRFPGWGIAGYHHGYIADNEMEGILQEINSSEPHLLLVGMGNPLQEKWIHDNQHSLKVPVCIGVGGLLDHWAGKLNRAPVWVRRMGIEWLQILIQQPHKWRRYLIGNLLFLARIRRHLRGDLAANEPEHRG